MRFSRGDNYNVLKIHRRNLKIYISVVFFFQKSDVTHGLLVIYRMFCKISLILSTSHQK